VAQALGHRFQLDTNDIYIFTYSRRQSPISFLKNENQEVKPHNQKTTTNILPPQPPLNQPTQQENSEKHSTPTTTNTKKHKPTPNQNPKNKERSSGTQTIHNNKRNKLKPNILHPNTHTEAKPKTAKPYIFTYPIFKSS
jgi:hypothetical protein